jgi:3-oxoacyl-[acyl-carrier-protein] synthase II
MGHRIVITGIGIISPLGLDTESTWQAILRGESGVDYITAFDPSPFETKFAAEVKGFDPLNYMDRKDARRTDRFTQFAIAAARESLRNAGLDLSKTDPNQVGVIIGSGIGGIITLSEQFKVLFERGPDRVSPFLVPMMIVDMAGGYLSILLGARGPNFCTVSACASGGDAIGNAYEILRRGDAQVMLAGGAEAPVCPIALAAFNAARAMSTRNEDPKRASRPFDRDRDGFVLGEGAAVLVLETLEHARGRGAPILAEIVGYGLTADAYHITQPAEDGEGGARAMAMALRKAGLAPTEVDYINAHGTSTPLNDRTETQAIKAVFGEHAYRLAVSSTKSMTGHLLGAAGAIEAAFCVLAIRDQVLPPTINLENPDPECDLDYVPNQARPARVRVAMSNAFGFGGHNSCLVIRAFDGS